MKDTKRKHLNNIKNLREENITLRIDNEVMRRQLSSIRNQISDILGDKITKMPDNASEKEQIKHFLETYYKGLGELKDIEMLHHGEKKKVEDVFKEAKEKSGLTKIKLDNLIGFENETQGQTKADWIKLNAFDFDIFIDDNPEICKEVLVKLND